MDDKQRLKEAKLVLRTITDLIERIEADIAKAEEKPELRHGDYGWDKGGNRRLVLQKDYGNKGLVHANDCYLYEGLPTCDITKKEGNIFADLTALQEDLTCFETDVHRYCIDEEQYPNVPIYMAGNHHSVAEVEEHISKLQRLVATYQRNQK